MVLGGLGNIMFFAQCKTRKWREDALPEVLRYLALRGESMTVDPQLLPKRGFAFECYWIAKVLKSLACKLGCEIGKVFFDRGGAVCRIML